MGPGVGLGMGPGGVKGVGPKFGPRFSLRVGPGLDLGFGGSQYEDIDHQLVMPVVQGWVPVWILKLVPIGLVLWVSPGWVSGWVLLWVLGWIPGLVLD